MKRPCPMVKALRKTLEWAKAHPITLPVAMSFLSGYCEQDHPEVARLLNELDEITARNGVTIPTATYRTYDPAIPAEAKGEAQNGEMVS